MPLRPFPFELNIGTDIVQLSRIYRLISKADTQPERRLEAFVRRLFTPNERNEFLKRFRLEQLAADQINPKVVSHLGGRWAAKEAIIKAVRHRKLTFHDIEIRRHETVNGRTGIYALILDIQNGRSPDHETTSNELDVSPPATSPDQDGDEVSGQIAKISISHDEEYATAVCIAVEEPMTGDVGGEAAARLV